MSLGGGLGFFHCCFFVSGKVQHFHLYLVLTLHYAHLWFLRKMNFILKGCSGAAGRRYTRQLPVWIWHLPVYGMQRRLLFFFFHLPSLPDLWESAIKRGLVPPPPLPQNLLSYRYGRFFPPLKVIYTAHYHKYIKGQSCLEVMIKICKITKKWNMIWPLYPLLLPLLMHIPFKI